MWRNGMRPARLARRCSANTVPALTARPCGGFVRRDSSSSGGPRCPSWLGILPTTEPRLSGVTVNPWRAGRTPGASSGGSAAAVAAGIVPLAHGGDGGGSLRVPAACCGLMGLKPSRGRISPAPAAGDDPMVTEGVLTRTVADTAALLDVLAGYEPGDATWAPPPAGRFRDASADPLAGCGSASRCRRRCWLPCIRNASAPRSRPRDCSKSSVTPWTRRSSRRCWGRPGVRSTRCGRCWPGRGSRRARGFSAVR